MRFYLHYFEEFENSEYFDYHVDFHIDSAARDAWLRCMKSAVDEIEADQALKDELWSYFEGAAQFLVNQEDK